MDETAPFGRVTKEFERESIEIEKSIRVLVLKVLRETFIVHKKTHKSFLYDHLRNDNFQSLFSFYKVLIEEFKIRKMMKTFDYFNNSFYLNSAHAIWPVLTVMKIVLVKA